MSNLSHVKERLEHHEENGPVRVVDQRPSGTPIQRINSRIGLFITIVVGTMWCAYVFAIIALLSLPQAITSHNLVIIVAWISSNFLQLVLLPIIIVGQNIQAKAADKRAEATYEDTIAIQRAALEIHALLQCIHANPQTGPCSGHPDLGIPPEAA